MRSLKSSLKPKKPKVLIIRRVKGDSMSPTLLEGQIIIASSLIKARPGRIVIVSHNGLEKIKRLTKISQKGLYILGDNSQKSSDSKDFGWIAKSSLIASVVWPIYQQKK